MSARIPAVVLGASGYVGAELLRLLAQHPRFDVRAAVSRDPGGATPAGHYPHLAATLGDLAYSSIDTVVQQLGDTADVAVFSAAPHGVSAAMVAALLDGRGEGWRVVDASADFRFADRAAYESIYATGHGAPGLLNEFTCALPEHLAGTPARHVAHPGCFATAMLLGIVPLVHEGLVAGPVYATGITGSTGSGKSPLATTHHPERHSNLYAYKPLTHRHAPEVQNLCAAATGQRPALNFVPHSGPFARGIHMTLQAALARPVDGGDVVEALRRYYAAAPFVTVVGQPPRIKDVATSNYARLSASAAGDSLAVTVVIDNLVKGAAGGAVQWMNRLFGFDETAGLGAAASGWL